MDGGLGPWFCALYCCLDEGAKKQTDLRVHTYPVLLERIMNGASNKTKGWVLVLMIGYFERWADAVAFHTLWSKQTRGKHRRIQRGIDLFHSYQQKHNLRMWTQPYSLDKAKKKYIKAYEHVKRVRLNQPRVPDQQVSLVHLAKEPSETLQLELIVDLQKKRRKIK